MRIKKPSANPDAIDLEAFRKFFDDAPIGKVITAPNGILRRVNPAFAEMLGYEPEELKVSFGEITHPDDVAESKAMVAALVQGKADCDEFAIEKRYLTKSGETVWAYVVTHLQRDSQHRPQFFITHIIDISERKALAQELEQKLREIEVRNQIAQAFLNCTDEELYSTVLDGVLRALDSHHGVFGYVDEKRMLILPTMTRHIWPECPSSKEKTVFALDTLGEGLWHRALHDKQMQCVNQPAAGLPEDHIPIERSLTAPIVYRGEVVGLIQVANKGSDYVDFDRRLLQTLTDSIAPILSKHLQQKREHKRRLKAEKTLQREAENLARSNRELEQFAYVASHDLQEPLRMVASYTQLLARRYRGQLDERADKYIHYAVDGAKRMQGLIDDLLSFSRLGTRAKAPILTDAHKVLTEVLQNLQQRVEESQAEISIAPLPQVMVDPTQLGQVLQNLISNAIKFCGDAPPKISISARERDRFWEFCVADEGIGIEAEFFTRIFTIFQRLHERGAYEGNGIGLAIVKKIVERHGGQVALESTPGEGSQFTFTLPKSQDIP